MKNKQKVLFALEQQSRDSLTLKKFRSALESNQFFVDLKKSLEKKIARFI